MRQREVVVLGERVEEAVAREVAAPRLVLLGAAVEAVTQAQRLGIARMVVELGEHQRVAHRVFVGALRVEAEAREDAGVHRDDRRGVAEGVVVGEEEERLVLAQRAAQREAEDLLRKRCFLFLAGDRVGLHVWVVRRQLVGPVVAIGPAAQLVGARARERVDDGARRLAELGVELAGDHLELGDRVECKLPAGVGERVGVVAEPVDEEGVVGAVAARGGHGDGRLVAARPAAVEDSRGEEDEVGEAAVGDRELVDLAGGEGGPERAARRFHDRRVAFDRHRLLARAHLQAKVEAGLLADAQRDAGAHRGDEPGERRGDLVAAGGKRRQPVVAPRVAAGAAFDCGVGVARGDRRTGDGGAGRVLHAALDLGRRDLRLRYRCGAGEEQRDDDDTRAVYAHGDSLLAGVYTPRVALTQDCAATAAWAAGASIAGS